MFGRFRKKAAYAAMLLSLGLAASKASADFVSYTVSGSSGDWTLDFTVTNDLGIDHQDIYVLGLNVAGGSVSSLPSGWTNYGSFSSAYNIGVVNFTSIPDQIQDGESLAGFRVWTSAADAPASVDWWLYHHDVSGGGATYYGNSNPHFSGTAAAAQVPEPETGALTLAGLGLMGVVARRRNRKPAA